MSSQGSRKELKICVGLCFKIFLSNWITKLTHLKKTGSTTVGNAQLLRQFWDPPMDRKALLGAGHTIVKKVKFMIW